MGSPSQLSLDYNPNTYSMIPKSVGDYQPAEQTKKLQDFLSRLDEERAKIEAFKRELPLCMQLLNNAMETYRRQLETYQANQGLRPVLDEFIPLSNKSISGSDKMATVMSEKANWMVSAQLWSPASDPNKQQKEPESQGRSFDTKHRNGGAFLPFTKEKRKGAIARSLASQGLHEDKEEVEGEKKHGEMEMNVNRENINGKVEQKQQEQRTKESGSNHRGEGQAVSGGGGGGEGGQNTHRKARRCWSPDLHRKFVNALQMLGGSQVATPKQIRELMKVDGLTNDEVKSHLQKYRLHTRRPIPPPQPPATSAPQLVVLGGIWVPTEYAASAAAAAAASVGPGIYGAHPASAHYPVPHEFFAAHPPPPGAHHHLHYSTSSVTAAYRSRLNSPDSEMRSSGDRSESIEEEGTDGEEREDEEEQEQEQEENVTEGVKEGKRQGSGATGGECN